MEDELFAGKWDGDTEPPYHYNDVVLKVQIGQFPAGTRFDSAIVGYDDGRLTLVRQSPTNPVMNDLYTFRLGLVVLESL